VNYKDGKTMSIREAYREKLEAELELARSELVKLRAQVKVSTADTRINCFKHIDHIEEAIDAGRAKLKELGEAGEGAWEEIMGDMEGIWAELSGLVQNSKSASKK